MVQSKNQCCTGQCKSLFVGMHMHCTRYAVILHEVSFLCKKGSLHQNTMILETLDIIISVMMPVYKMYFYNIQMLNYYARIYKVQVDITIYTAKCANAGKRSHRKIPFESHAFCVSFTSIAANPPSSASSSSFYHSSGFPFQTKV